MGRSSSKGHPAIWSYLEEELSCDVTSERARASRCGRGDTSDAYKYTVANEEYFVKINDKEASKNMFKSEAKGLRAMRKTRSITVPKVYGYGSLPDEEGSFLILEYLELTSMSSSCQTKLGEQLAALHVDGSEDRFGFHMNNFIGATPQVNTWSTDWVDFFRKHRLQFQLDLAVETSKISKASEVYRLGQELCDDLDSLFRQVRVKPSLLHGDLWAGNVACLRDSLDTPVIFDPAAYYGHHEADLGIARIFGGFSASFWEAYHEAIPKAKGFKQRAHLYEIYHMLNHLNIFGTVYEHDCVSRLRKLVG